MIFSKIASMYPAKNLVSRYPVILIFLFSCMVLSGQNSSLPFRQYVNAPDTNQAIGSIDEYLLINQNRPAEKIFLHTDRNNYRQGDTIWLKAYLWYGYEQVADTISGVLYADLTDMEGHVVINKKLLIRNGISNGEFSLDSTISPGKYFIRAYTRLMQSMRSGEPFYRLVNITSALKNFKLDCTPAIIKGAGIDSLRIGLRFTETDSSGYVNINFRHHISYLLKIGDRILMKGTVYAENRKETTLKYSLAGEKDLDSIAKFDISIRDTLFNYDKQLLIPIHEGIDVQFLPEGGTLVNGLASRIAFKSIGPDGQGREIEGEIRTDDGNIIIPFRSRNNGMGSFWLKPVEGRRYFARLRYNDINYTVALPQASPGGSVMSVSYPGIGEERILSIKQNNSGSVSQKYIVGSSHGKIWFSALLKSFIDSAGFKIPLELIPEGICRITVLNEHFKPECEWLIYVDKDQRFKIEVVSDSLSYGTRSKVTLHLKATDQGGAPAEAEMSIAVLDKENADTSDRFSITGYKLLESELHGDIGNASSWFVDGRVADKSSLDLLLLTNGYRKFVTEKQERAGIEFQPEKSINVSGRIELKNAGSGGKSFNYTGIRLTLFTNSDKSYLALSNPDSLGMFRFSIPLTIGKPHAMIQATTFKKKPLKGEITLDRPISIQKQFSVPSVKSEMILPAKQSVSFPLAEIKNEPVKQKYYGTMHGTLQEVFVTAKADSRTWFSNYDRDATHIANLDSIDPGGDKYLDLNHLLMSEFKAIPYSNSEEELSTVLLPCIQTICDKHCLSFWFPIYVLNGNTYWNCEGFDFTGLRTISALRTDEIKKIMVIPPMRPIVIHHAWIKIWDFPQYIMQSMVVIETYSQDGYRGDPPGIKTFLLDGLDAPRVFYSPSYEGQKRQNPQYDNRVTLYWNPLVRTDPSGNAKVEFYTGDRKAGLDIIVNGIEINTGNPGEKQMQIK
jgi:hypothetical protein